MLENVDRWLSVDEICKYLGIGKDSIYKWIDMHGMPAQQMGRLRKFIKVQVDAWVEAGGAATGATEDQEQRMPVKKN